MRTINYLIVEISEAYENSVVLPTGQELHINSMVDEVSHIRRIAKVVSSPDYTILKPNDEVIVHHNIFRLRGDTKGNIIQSNYFIEKNLYFVPLTEIFMYRRNDEEWQSIDPFCFVKPVTKEKSIGFTLSLKEDSYKGNEFNQGVMTYPNESLMKQGVQKGDTVVFSNNSEYEFVINNETYYRMKTKDILLVK